MTKDRFWEIIAASREGFDPEDIEASQERQLLRLRDLLAQLPAEEVQAFDQHFCDRMREAYIPARQRDKWGTPLDGLWGVAFQMGGGCSNDCFLDFRSWLISMGREAFEAAVRDPETVYGLVEAAEDAEDVSDIIFFEGFQYVASRVWREKTGRPD
jgi:hypothetical protein